MQYRVSHHGVSVACYGGPHDRKRADAAAFVAWREIYSALEGAGLLDSVHAWNLRAQWKALCQRMKEPGPFAETFHPTAGHQVLVARWSQ